MNLADIYLSIIMRVVIGMLIAIILLLIIIMVGSDKHMHSYYEKIGKSEKIQKKSQAYHFGKRVIDILFSGILLILTSPLTLIITFFIKMEDGGPVTHELTCIGYKGKTVRYRVFRVYRIHQEKECIACSYNTSYTTKIGSFLRNNLYLYYIPMFAAVFRGDLTMIGLARQFPMFFSPSHKNLFEYEKPGVLGLSRLVYAKIKMMDNDKLFNQFQLMKELDLNQLMKELDLVYLQTRSVITDTKILMNAAKDIFIRNTYLEKREE